ncbi:MAG: transglutaminase family protein [Pseudomonadota bacterium]
MNYRITHETVYRYADDVARCFNRAYLLPRHTDRQQCLDARVHVSPTPPSIDEYQDYFANRVTQFAIHQRHRELSITAESNVVMREPNLSASLDIGLTCAEVLSRLRSDRDAATLAAREFLLPSPMIRPRDEFGAYAAPCFAPDRPFLAACRDFSEKIFEEFRYDPGFTTVATPVRAVLEHRRGVCQDFAHLAIACLRALGYAARYVSGYLETLPPPGKEKLIGADATHAWFSVYSPGEGWTEFDPTNNKPAGLQHIVTAEGRDYSDVTPVSGVIFGGGDSHQLDVAVTVARTSGAPIETRRRS